MATIIPTQKMLAHPKIITKVMQTLRYFPELKGYRVIVGITSQHNHAGSADKEDMIIRLNPDYTVHYATIAHELIHLLQYHLEILPGGEVTADIYYIVRSKHFLDKPPTYLAIDNDKWEENKHKIRIALMNLLQLRYSPRKISHNIRKRFGAK